MDTERRQALTQIFNAAVASVDPRILVRESISMAPGSLVAAGVSYQLTEINNIYVVGAGKAAHGMASAVEDLLGGLVTGGAIVTKDGHGGRLSRISVFEASHPVPDLRGVSATRVILDIVRNATDDDLVIFLLSGGASSLLVQPAPGITLKDKQELTRLMLDSGADIGELNTVRKRLSAVKGGRLAEAAFPAPALTLAISDVMGDDMGLIGSGPTAPDDTTFLQAEEILKMRGVYDRAPRAVTELLEKGVLGYLPDTPKPGAYLFERVNNMIIGSNIKALRKAEEVAGYLGFSPLVRPDALSGEARDAAKMVAEDVRRYRRTGGPTPACLIYGGETTVTVTGGGKGGRNQEVAAAFALEIKGDEGVAALFAGTDGTDGPTDAAGGFADGGLARRAEALGLDACKCLGENDTYRLLEASGDLFVTGPTGTNVMDVGLVMIY